MTIDVTRNRNLPVSNRPGQAGGAGALAGMPAVNASSDTLRSKPSLAMSALLLVEMIVGYEWFMSGLVKVVHGDFPSGLAAALLDKSASAAPWYSNLITSVFIPNAVVYGYVVEITELLAGVALIAGPLLWLFAWDRVSDHTRLAVLFFTAVATVGGAFLAVNLSIANGAGHPWLIAASSFDEGIDLDSVLPAILLVIATVSIIQFRRLRRERAGTPAPRGGN